MRIIDYTESLAPLKGASILYRNPKYWDGGVEARVDFVSANDPRILKRYREAGILPWAGGEVERPVTPSTPKKEVDNTIPDNWLSLPWTQKKALAMRFSTAQIKTKQQAEDILYVAYRNQSSA